jgi:hypothetical protein
MLPHHVANADAVTELILEFLEDALRNPSHRAFRERSG